jgi:hypothetical protein
MKQKRIFIILGALGIIFLLFWFAVITLVVKNVWGSNKTVVPPVVDLTLCDEDASGLCIVTFGANSLNRMVINFQLPDADYAAFYLKVTSRGTVNMYSCGVAKAVPTSAYCTGIRTPLGETIDIEVYNAADDTLIARGSFLVSAVALATPVILPSETPPATADTATPMDDTPTPTAFSGDTPTETPTGTESTPTPMPTDTAYPNP